jgi:formate dehydrogenase subunit delta
MTESATHESPELRLLGDITEQFRHLPLDRAAEQVATHIRQFWDPRMRAELMRLLAPPTGDDLVDAVIARLD